MSSSSLRVLCSEPSPLGDRCCELFVGHAGLHRNSGSYWESRALNAQERADLDEVLADIETIRGMVYQLDADLCSVRFAVDQVRQLHHRSVTDDGEPFCAECAFTYPCRTIQLLDGNRRG